MAALAESPQLPEWVRFAHESPRGAVAALISGDFDFGRDNARERSDLLIDWLSVFAHDEAFVDGVDEALAAWIDDHWSDLPSTEDSRRIRAWEWVTALNVAAYGEALETTAGLLRRRFDERHFLESLAVGPALDPVARYLFAVAAHQQDRSLVPFWFELSATSPLTAAHRGAVAVAGVRGAPALPEEEGRFRSDIPQVIIRLAHGLGVAAEAHRIADDAARRELFDVAGATMAAIPPVDRWRRALARAVGLARDGRRVLHPLAIEWLEELGAPPQETSPDQVGVGAGAGIRGRFRQWEEEAAEIERLMGRDFHAGRARAEQLIAEERKYATLTGFTEPLVISLVRFARNAEDQDPARAADWCDEARTWEPWNAYTWTVGVRAKLRAGDTVEALDLGWRGLWAFPENVYVYRELGTALVTTSHFHDAEEVFRSGLDRFPENEGLVDGLVEALVSQDAEGRELARTELARFVARRGPLKRPHTEAKLRPDFVPAERVQSENRATVARARLMRRAARRRRAASMPAVAFEEQARKTLDEVPESAESIAEHGLLLLETGDEQAAIAVLDHADASENPNLLYARVRAQRELARSHQWRLVDTAQREAVEAPINRLVSAASTLRPMETVFDLRALAALRDGPVREREMVAKAVQAQAALEHEPVRSPADRFWRARIAPLLADNDDAGTLESTLEKHALLLDTLEEDLTARAAAVFGA